MAIDGWNKFLLKLGNHGKALLACLVLVPVLWVLGRGSSRAPVAISLTPGTTSLTVGQSQTFTAVITNASNTAVSVEERRYG